MDPDPLTGEISKEQIEGEVREFLQQAFLSDEDPAALTEDTLLISSGVLDSIALVKLVAHLEENYRMEFEAHEMSAEYLDTLALIAETVQAKLT